MKISFSTLCCPHWTWDEILATASDLGYDGIEVRGVGNELSVPKAKPFLEDNLISTKARLNKMKLEIPILTSSCYLNDKENRDKQLHEGKEYIQLAGKLEVPYVRILGDLNPEKGEDIDVGFVAGNLRELSQYAQEKKVELLVETNGFFAQSDSILSLLDKTGCKNIGILWDVHHPFRFMGEKVQETYTKLKCYIRHIHIKDSVIENGKVSYKMLGCGDIPVKEIIDLLEIEGFKGYVSLEWVKRWCMDLEEPGIVLPHFINYIKKLIY
jgi:sugar phosphate isomerase/epimerase